jgi:hypothetical protein
MTLLTAMVAILMKCKMLLYSKVRERIQLLSSICFGRLSQPYKVLFANACRFYYLFQHHTTVERAVSDGMIRGTLPTCNSIITTLGPQVSLLSLDARGERTKYDICRPQTYKIIFEHLYRMVPPTTRHLIVITGVPIIYPRLTFFENAMDGLRDFNLATLVGKTGALGDIINGQLNNWNGDPELLDDMNDRALSVFCHRLCT